MTEMELIDYKFSEIKRVSEWLATSMRSAEIMVSDEMNFSISTQVAGWVSMIIGQARKYINDLNNCGTDPAQLENIVAFEPVSLEAFINKQSEPVR